MIMKNKGLTGLVDLVDVQAVPDTAHPTETFNNLSPCTSAGDIIIHDGTNNIRLAGNVDSMVKYLVSKGDGTEATVPYWDVVSTAGLLIYFLYHDASDIGGYKVCDTAIPAGVESTLTYSALADGDTLLDEFATPSGHPGLDYMFSGIWNLNIHAAKTTTDKEVRLYFEVYKRTTGGVETLVGTSYNSNVLGTSSAAYIISYNGSITDLDLTDRIVIKVYSSVSGTGTDPDVSLYIEGTTTSRIEFPTSAVDATNFVPYSGATGAVDLGTNTLASGSITVGTNTAGANVTVNATLGTELVDFTPAGWNEDGATWTMGATGPLVHVAGNTTTVTATLGAAIVAGTTYKVVITGTGGGGTATYTLGGVTGTTIAASGAIAITDYITAATTASLIITPASGCTVSITSISAKALTDATGDVTVDGNIIARSQIVSHAPIIASDRGISTKADLGIGSTDWGFYHALSGVGIGIIVNGAEVGRISSNAISLFSNTGVFSIGSAGDVKIYRDAAGTIAQRDSTTQQVSRIYNTYTDASNYERLTLTGVQGASVNLTAETAGTGADNLNIVLTPAGTGSVVIPTIDVDAGSIDGTLMGATKTNIQKGPAAVTTATTPAVTGTVTAAASTTVTFSSAADAILAGYSATNPILGTTLISNGLTRSIVSWTNATTCVVSSSVTWAGTAITSVQLPISSEVTSASPGVLKRATLADGTEYFVGNVGIGTTEPSVKLQVNDGDIYARTTSGGTLRSLRVAVGGGTIWHISPDDSTTSDKLVFSSGSNPVDIPVMTLENSGNVGIGTTTFGTSAAKVLAMGEGTAPTAVIANGVQFWSADRDGVAGDNRWHLMSEKSTATVIIGDGQVEFNAPANGKGTGIVVYRQAGENLVYKDSCYIKTDGKMWKTDADSYTTMPTTRIALETISANAWGLFLEYGYMRDDTWTWTIGGTIYADTTTGAWTQTAVSGQSDVLQIIGVAESATVAKVNPSWITTEIGLDIEDKSSAGYAITWAELTSVPKTFICDSADPKGFTFASAPTAADIGKSVRIVKSLAGAGTVTVTAPAATYIDDSSAAGTIACPGSARASITLQVISATQIAIVAAVGTWTTA